MYSAERGDCSGCPQHLDQPFLHSAIDAVVVAEGGKFLAMSRTIVLIAILVDDVGPAVLREIDHAKR